MADVNNAVVEVVEDAVVEEAVNTITAGTIFTGIGIVGLGAAIGYGAYKLLKKVKENKQLKIEAAAEEDYVELDATSEEE